MYVLNPAIVTHNSNQTFVRPRGATFNSQKKEARDDSGIKSI